MAVPDQTGQSRLVKRLQRRIDSADEAAIKRYVKALNRRPPPGHLAAWSDDKDKLKIQIEVICDLVPALQEFIAESVGVLIDSQIHNRRILMLAVIGVLLAVFMPLVTCPSNRTANSDRPTQSHSSVATSRSTP